MGFPSHGTIRVDASSRLNARDDALLTERFYVELRSIAGRLLANERNDHTLQPTAVVHEACLRLLTSSALPDGPRSDRLALCARVMRQVLIDHHRRRAAEKRGGAVLRVELDPQQLSPRRHLVEFSALDEALERLRALHERRAEVATLRLLGGLDMGQVASALGVARRTVEDDWTVARAWLQRELAS